MAKTLGVIVGRFQAAQLTPGHVHLINTALLQNDGVLVLVGEAPRRNEPDVPINFIWRQSMIQSDPRLYKNGKWMHVEQINDVGDDNVWMQFVLQQIRQYSTADDTVRLYGSRDSSFLKAFQKAEAGDIKYEIVELLPFAEFSASERRQQIASQYPTGRPEDDKIREGMIIAANQHFPTVFSTVDVFPFQLKKNGPDGLLGIWLGRKHKETKWRFIGGFAEPTSRNDEEDAAREVKEETGLDIDTITYIGNYAIDDWRYKSSKNKIRTRLFAAIVTGGVAMGADDIAEVKWFSLQEILSPNMNIVTGHKALVLELENWLSSREAPIFYKKLLKRAKSKKGLPML